MNQLKGGGNTMKTQKGFTLVELLVVVSIIGLLSTLAVVALGSARVQARDAKRVADVKQMQTALELYFSDNNGYPGSDGGGSGLTLGSGNFTALTRENGFENTPSPGTETVYMGNVPANPSPGGADYVYLGLDSDRTTECTSGACAAYSITFTLESDSTGIAAGAHTATPEGIN